MHVRAHIFPKTREKPVPAPTASQTYHTRLSLGDPGRLPVAKLEMYFMFIKLK